MDALDELRVTLEVARMELELARAYLLDQPLLSQRPYDWERDGE